MRLRAEYPYSISLVHWGMQSEDCQLKKNCSDIFMSAPVSHLDEVTENKIMKSKSLIFSENPLPTPLKEYFTHKWKLCHYLLTLMLVWCYIHRVQKENFDEPILWQFMLKKYYNSNLLCQEYPNIQISCCPFLKYKGNFSLLIYTVQEYY